MLLQATVFTFFSVCLTAYDKELCVFIYLFIPLFMILEFISAFSEVHAYRKVHLDLVPVSTSSHQCPGPESPARPCTPATPLYSHPGDRQ